MLYARPNDAFFILTLVMSHLKKSRIILEQATTTLKRSQVVDNATGKVDLRYNPLSVDEDYFIPVRGGDSGTKIDTLAGGQNTAAIEDVEYIQKKLFAALKIPTCLSWI